MTTSLLVDTQTFSDFRGLDAEDTSAQAQFALEAASDVFRSLTGRSFDLVEGDVVRCHGTGTDRLVLPNEIVPVLSVDEVVVIDPDLGDVTLDAADYLLGSSSILHRVAFTTSQIGITNYGWPKGVLNVQVTCDHGFEEVPSGVQDAVCRLAFGVLLAGSTGGQTIESESLGAYSVTYATTTASTEVQVPGSVASVIDAWRLPSLVPPTGVIVGASS